jgi:hypothetical protein
MRTIIAITLMILIACIVAPFLNATWSNPKIGDMSAVTMTGFCLFLVFSPAYLFKPVRDFFAAPRKG